MVGKIGKTLLAAALIWMLALPALAAPEDQQEPRAEGQLETQLPADNPAGDQAGTPPDQVDQLEQVSTLPEQADGIEQLETQVVDGGSGADPSYSGPLDPLTGQPLEGNRGEQESYYPLKEGEYGYDRENRSYTNHVGERAFASNVPNGAILTEGNSVSFTLPGGLAGTLYRSGNVVSEADLTDITQAGSYLLEVQSSSGTEKVSFSFQIVRQLTNAVTEFPLPGGFTFEYVTLNGETMTPEYANYLELIEDGNYEIRWACPEIGQSYTLSFTLDTGAPTLALPEVSDGQARGPVTVADLEAGCYIVLESDGESSTIADPATVIKDPGTYRLTVYDQAGNSTRYDFTIHAYLNISAFVAIALVLAGVGALWGYSRYVRKHPRVG